MIIRNRKLIENGVSLEMLTNCISEHKKDLPRLKMLINYYNGEADIKKRVLDSPNQPNNKLVHNIPKYIVDIVTGYVAGNPITFTGEGSNIINEINKSLDIHSHDTELQRDISIYGVGFELLYFNQGELEIATASPLESFLVKDNTIKNNPLFGVRYFPNFGEDGKISDWSVVVYTDDKTIYYICSDVLNKSSYKVDYIEENYFKKVPLVEYKNNKVGSGCYQNEINLINSYNILESDRINNIEQFVNSLMIFKNVSLGSSEEEIANTMRMIERYKMIEIDSDSGVEYLVKSLNQSEVEILRQSIKEDIHELTLVPCLTDKNFSVNASGVAMKYKLLGLEQLAQTKESYFKKSLRLRLNLIEQALRIKGIVVNTKGIQAVFKRSLPANELELSNVVSILRGTVSQETLLSLLPFVEDAQLELSKVEEERKKDLIIQQESFNSFGFDVPEQKGDDVVDEEE